MKRAHLIGVGGAGVSSIAKYLHKEGYKVSGSDSAYTETIKQLEQEYGLTYTGPAKAEAIASDIELVVYTPAIQTDDTEYTKAKSFGIQCYSYPEFLGHISHNKKTIAIAGTNGKTTTTSMIGETLDKLGLDPTIVVGGVMAEYGSNFKHGNSDWFVVEACEYKESFLNLEPQVVALTNITPDHLDYFRTVENYHHVFVQLIEKIKPGGVLICNTTDPNLAEVIAKAKERNITVVATNQGHINEWKLKLPGQYNKENAELALRTVEVVTDRDSDAVVPIIEAYKGTKRRFEYIGVTKYQTPIYDDYGHNPEGIEGLIKGVREFLPNQKIIVIFQPHLYSRTKDLFQGFVDALVLADEVHLLPIYAAREKDSRDVSSQDLQQAIISKTHCIVYDSVEDVIKNFAVDTYNQDSVIITLGAGNTDKVAQGLKVQA